MEKLDNLFKQQEKINKMVTLENNNIKETIVDLLNEGIDMSKVKVELRRNYYNKELYVRFDYDDIKVGGISISVSNKTSEFADKENNDKMVIEGCFGTKFTSSTNNGLVKHKILLMGKLFELEDKILDIYHSIDWSTMKKQRDIFAKEVKAQVEINRCENQTKIDAFEKTLKVGSCWRVTFGYLSPFPPRFKITKITPKKIYFKNLLVESNQIFNVEKDFFSRNVVLWGNLEEDK